MFVGLIINLGLSPESPIRDSVTFDYQFFFNLLLPPIILASGYELHQVSSAPWSVYVAQPGCSLHASLG